MPSAFELIKRFLFSIAGFGLLVIQLVFELVGYANHYSSISTIPTSATIIEDVLIHDSSEDVHGRAITPSTSSSPTKSGKHTHPCLNVELDEKDTSKSSNTHGHSKKKNHLEEPHVPSRLNGHYYSNSMPLGHSIDVETRHNALHSRRKYSFLPTNLMTQHSQHELDVSPSITPNRVITHMNKEMNSSAQPVDVTCIHTLKTHLQKYKFP